MTEQNTEAIREMLRRDSPRDFFKNWDSFRPSLDAGFRGAAEYLAHELTRPWSAEELAYMEGCPAPDADQGVQPAPMKIDRIYEADDYYFSDSFGREASGMFFVGVYGLQIYSAEPEDEEAYSGINHYDVTGNWTVYFEMDQDALHGRIIETTFDGFSYVSGG